MQHYQNLIPAKKGEIRNPYGKKGKDGTKGIHIAQHIKELLEDSSFAYTFKNGFYLQDKPIKAIIYSLTIKALEGDTRAAEMLIKYGYESNQARILETPKINVVIDSSYSNKPAFKT